MRETWEPTPVLLPGKFHGWRSLIGYSPWGGKESDMTEQLHFHFTFFRKGQWNALETTRVTKSSGKIVSEKELRRNGDFQRRENYQMPVYQNACQEHRHWMVTSVWLCLLELSSGEVKFLSSLLDLCIIPWCPTLHNPLGGDSTTSYFCVLGKFLSFL